MTAPPTRRLSFGTVAELYDEARPSYPEALVDDVIGFAGLEPPDRLLEVGAGTGKATVLFAARGFRVLGIEPSAQMAALARRNCAPYSGVHLEETDFEHWSGESASFALVFSAQAWHWVAPEAAYAKARFALRPGGALATFWTFPIWEECELRGEFAAAYDRREGVVGADDALNPRGEADARTAEGAGRLAVAAGFSLPELRSYRWSLEYTTDQYLRLMSTHSSYVVLADVVRNALFADVAEAIDRHGGSLKLPLLTRLYLARAVA